MIWNIRRVWFRVLLVAAVSGTAGVPGAKAALFYQSATTLRTGATTGAGGVQTDTEFYSGVNFQVTTPVTVDHIGGHFYNSFVNGNNAIFGAIVPVTGQFNPPAPADLSSNVLATTLITLPPQGTSDNVKGALSLTLQPGWYGEIFGSGRFGATADFTIAVATRDDGAANAGLVQTYALRQPDGAFFRQAAGVRYFVEGTVPEPGTAGLLIAVGWVVMSGQRGKRVRAAA